MTKKDLVIAIKASDRREDKEQKLQRRLRKQLGRVLAAADGIVVGREIYVMPIPGRKFKAVVKDIGEAWREKYEHYTLLIYYYNRNGMYRSDWVDSNRNEFIPIKES